MTRTPGKYGRRPATGAPRLKLSQFLSVLPAHPASVDYLASLDGGWEMLGNDTYGDCVAVTWANTRRLVTATLATEYYPTLDQVLTFYRTQNPGFPSQDGGMVIQDALDDLHKNGGPDGVFALAFAEVDHTNVEEVKAAIAIFGSVWTGIDVRQINEQEFSDDEAWDYHAASPDAGGHSIITGGYGQPGDRALSGDERFITWAEETSFTDAFWSHQVSECWIVIWPEHLQTKAFMEGVDLDALSAAYTALTGRPFPIQPEPNPNPEPTPQPIPVVDPADQALAVAQTTWEQHEDNMRTMRSCDRTLETANRAWRAAKGL